MNPPTPFERLLTARASSDSRLLADLARAAQKLSNKKHTRHIELLVDKPEMRDPNVASALYGTTAGAVLRLEEQACKSLANELQRSGGDISVARYSLAELLVAASAPIHELSVQPDDDIGPWKYLNTDLRRFFGDALIHSEGTTQHRMLVRVCHIVDWLYSQPISAVSSRYVIENPVRRLVDIYFFKEHEILHFARSKGTHGGPKTLTFLNRTLSNYGLPNVDDVLK